MQLYDVIIIGAGPAGLQAAITCRQHNLQVVVLDEFPEPGGRLLGQLHEEPTGEWWNGIKETNRLLHEAEKLDLFIKCHTSVYHIEKSVKHFIVHTQESKYNAKAVLIATGAAESAVPIPGWDLPGVMSIGAAQVMTNVHRVKVGERGIIVGVNILSAAIARELQLAGITIKHIALPTSNALTKEQASPLHVMQQLIRIAHLAPSFFLRLGSKFAKPSFMQKLALKFYPKRGVNMWGMPVHLRKAIQSINGEEYVESVTMVDITDNGKVLKHSEQTIPVDFVCIAGGLYPLTELAAVIGCPFLYNEALGGHVPIHNEQMETPINGVFVAGNITGIENAQIAMKQGHVAGLSITKYITKQADHQEKIKAAIEEVKYSRAQATIQFHPHIIDGRENVHEQFNIIMNEKES